MNQLAQTRRPVLLQSYIAEECNSALGSHFAKTKSTTNRHVGDRTASKHNNTWVRILHCILCPDMITLRAYVKRTILHKCTVAARRAQAVDTRPFFFFFCEQPGYEASHCDHICIYVYMLMTSSCKAKKLNEI